MANYSKNQKLVIKTGIVLACIIVFVIYRINNPHVSEADKEEIYTEDVYENDESIQTDTLAAKELELDNQVFQKIENKASRDFPNDFTTQEYWINEQKEAYYYMKSIPDNEIKSKAEKDFPIDFTTQKYWYNEQIEAQERLNK